MLADLASKDKGLPFLKNPIFSFNLIREILPMSQVLSGLYLPSDTPDVLVPPARRYTLPTVWTSTFFGSGYAYSKTGKLETIQSANLAAKSESTWAGVYIVLPTNRSRYGQTSLITLDVDINWVAHHPFSSDPVWNQRLDGYVWLYSNVWLVAYVLNTSTGSWDPVSGPSAVKIPLFASTWYINEGGEYANSGSLTNGEARLQFLASSPPQTYLMGVVFQSTADQNIRNVDGQPITPPQSGQFITYALTKGDVPDMFVTYNVLTS